MKKDDLISNDHKIIDNRTSYGKGLSYKGEDGHEYATLEEVKEANRFYLGLMGGRQQTENEKTKTESERKYAKYYTYIGKDGREYKTTLDLERVNKAYFDYINSIMLNVNDKNMSKETFRAQQEKIIGYIQERYEDYLEDLLEKYGYNQQNNNKGPKR